MMTLLSEIAFLRQRSVTASLKFMVKTFNSDLTDFVNMKHVYVSLKCFQFLDIEKHNLFFILYILCVHSWLFIYICLMDI